MSAIRYRVRKLTRDQVRELIAAYDTNEPVADIAARFGITPSAVSYHAAKHTVLRRDRIPEHGTTARYQRHAKGTACEPCLAAWRDKMRAYNAAKAAS